MKDLLLIAALAGLAACSSDPVDAEGMYSINVTNRENGCNFAMWQVDNSAPNIPVVINQQDTDANADVMGLAGGYLDFILGSHVFNGSVDGNDLDLKITGTKSSTQGNCTLTVDARLLCSLNGDVLTGRINYSYHGNGNSDCAPYDGCISFQEMNGARPPQ